MGALIIFPISAALAVLAKRRFEETVFPAIGVVILTLTVAGELGYLSLGICLIPIYLIASIVLLIIRRADFMKYVLTPGLLAFVIFFVFFLVFSYGRYFTSDVALSKYGLAVLNMHETGTLKDTLPYYDQNCPPPLVSVWAYFCTFTSGGFNEWLCIFSYDIFIISAVMPLFSFVKSVKKGSWQWLFMLLFCISLPILKIPTAYSCYDMAVPQALSIVYTYLILQRLISVKISNVSKWWYTGFMAYGILMSCTLTQYGIYASIPLIMGIGAVAVADVKSRKIIFVGLGSGCLLATGLVVYAKLSAGAGGMLVIPEWCLACVLMAVIFTLVISLYEKGYKIPAVLIMVLIMAVITALVVFILKNSPNSAYLRDWFMEYTDKIFVGRKEEADYLIGKRVIPVFDVPFLFIMMVAFGMASGRIIRKEPDRATVIRNVNISLVFGTVLYMVVLCVLYINSIRQQHSSVKPTIAIYIAPVLLLSAVAVFLQSLRAWKKDYAIVVGTVVLIACVFSDPVSAVFNKPEYEDPYPLIKACKDEELLELSGDDRIFYIDKDLTADLPAEFVWAVFPAGADCINGLYFNPEPNKWVDYIKEPLSAEEFADMLRDGHYTYVYLRNVDESFVDMYYADFADAGADIRSDALYRVEYNDSGLQIIYIAGVAQEDNAEAE